MRVLVTGASGRLGPFVAKDLETHGHDVVLTSRHEPPDDVSHLPWVRVDLNVYEDYQALNAFGPFDAIQHVAAMPGPSDHPARLERSREQGIPLDATMRTNIMGTYYLLRFALAHDIDVFVMSGSNCADGHCFRISDRPFPIAYLPIDEEHPTDVEDSYSYSKLAGEELLASYTRAYGIRTHTVRPAVIWSPARRKAYAESVEPATSWNGGLWAWVGSEDVASAQRLLMEQAYAIEPNGVYYCNGDDTRALEPSMELVERFKPALLPEVQGELEGHATFFSNRRLHETVGWEPKTSWREHLSS